MTIEGWARRRALVQRRLPRGAIRDAAIDVIDALDMGVEPNEHAVRRLLGVVQSANYDSQVEARASLILAWARIETPHCGPESNSWGSVPLHPDSRAFIGGLQSTETG